MQKNRRRQVIVNKGLQSRIVVASILVPCIVLAGLCMLLAVYCRRLHDEALEADLDLPSMIPVFMVIVGLVFFETLIMVVFSVRLSHRIAGPGINVQHTMERFRDGDYDSRVLLRKGDLLGPTADLINEMLDWTQQKISEPSAQPNPPEPNPTETEIASLDITEQVTEPASPTVR